MTYLRGPRRELHGEDIDDVETLRNHLIDDHERAAHELDGLPLAAVHVLEHFDASMGLLSLRHRHVD